MIPHYVPAVDIFFCPAGKTCVFFSRITACRTIAALQAVMPAAFPHGLPPAYNCDLTDGNEVFGQLISAASGGRIYGGSQIMNK